MYLHQIYKTKEKEATKLIKTMATKKIEISPIENFNLSQYLGKWYEIARLNHSFEKGLTHVTAEYSLDKNNKVRVTNRGYLPAKGKWQEAHARAVQTHTPNFFKVYFVPLIAGKYRIAYISSDYSAALVSGGTTKYLWLLSKTPLLNEQEKEHMLSLARKLGYDTSELIWVEQ